MRGFDPGGGFPLIPGYVNFKLSISIITEEVDIDLGFVVGIGTKDFGNTSDLLTRFSLAKNSIKLS